MINFDAIIFDFDGVLLESEFVESILAELLSSSATPHAQGRARTLYRTQPATISSPAMEQRIGGPFRTNFTSG